MAINALMQFIPKDSDIPILGESQSLVDPTDVLAMTDATWVPGFYFEVEDFEFSLELDENSGVDRGNGGGRGGADEYARKVDLDDLREEVRRMEGKSPYAASGSDKKGSEKKEGRSGRGGRFDEYVTGNQDPAAYKPRVAPFSFKKQIDLASAPLISNCFKPTAFSSATLIKRKDAGATLGMVGSLSYVRFDFVEPLITSVELSVEETVRQSVKFVCRQVTITYAPQLSSGLTVAYASTAVLKLNG